MVAPFIKTVGTKFATLATNRQTKKTIKQTEKVNKQAAALEKKNEADAKLAQANARLTSAEKGSTGAPKPASSTNTTLQGTSGTPKTTKQQTSGLKTSSNSIGKSIAKTTLTTVGTSAAVVGGTMAFSNLLPTLTDKATELFGGSGNSSVMDGGGGVLGDGLYSPYQYDSLYSGGDAGYGETGYVEGDLYGDEGGTGNASVFDTIRPYIPVILGVIAVIVIIALVTRKPKSKKTSGVKKHANKQRKAKSTTVTIS